MGRIIMDLDTTMVQVPLRLLLRMQWQSAYADGKCPICGERNRDGHRSDCSLAAAIKPVYDEVRIQKED